MSGVKTRLAVWAAVLIMAVAAVSIWIVTMQNDDQGPRSVNVQLLNKNDGKDNCPNDGNAGGGNDNKGPGGGCVPPAGGYGNIGGNPNDGKDNCPNDGNAGGGNDNKGPNGGCRTK